MSAGPKVRLAEWRRDYEAGMSTVAVAARYGTTPGRVSRVLRAAGVEMRPRGAPKGKLKPGSRVPEILRLLDAGHSRAEVARRLGVTWNAVHQARKRRAAQVQA